MSKLDEVVEVDIDPEGRFKYILVKIRDSGNNTKTIVRGYKWASYHGELFSCYVIVIIVAIDCVRHFSHCLVSRGQTPSRLLMPLIRCKKKIRTLTINPC